MLAMKRGLAAAFADVPPNSAQYAHLLAEIEKRIFADRAGVFEASAGSQILFICIYKSPSYAPYQREVPSLMRLEAA
jgi:hypothetical protein